FGTPLVGPAITAWGAVFWTVNVVETVVESNVVSVTRRRTVYCPLSSIPRLTRSFQLIVGEGPTASSKSSSPSRSQAKVRLSPSGSLDPALDSDRLFPSLI